METVAHAALRCADTAQSDGDKRGRGAAHTEHADTQTQRGKLDAELRSATTDDSLMRKFGSACQKDGVVNMLQRDPNFK